MRESLPSSAKTDSDIFDSVMKCCAIIEGVLKENGRFHNDKDDGNPPEKQQSLKQNFSTRKLNEKIPLHRQPNHDLFETSRGRYADSRAVPRAHGMSNATFHKWRTKQRGMDTSMMAQLKELELENQRLKKMYAEEGLNTEIETVKDFV